MVGSISLNGVLSVSGSSIVAAPVPRKIIPPTALQADTAPAPSPALARAAFAPASMAALIETQAQMSTEASPLARTQTAQELDQLISRLSDNDPPPPPPQRCSLTLRRLVTARGLIA
ncbi:MAG: hypothetical protein ACJ798_03730 [Phenylobacterium sp.]